MSELRTEARLLLETVQVRLQAMRSLLPTAPPPPRPTACEHCGASAEAGAGPAAGSDPNTLGRNGCPLCTLIALLRGERPDLAGALFDGADIVLQAVRSLVTDESAQGAGEPSTAVPSSAVPSSVAPPGPPAAPSTDAVPPAAAQRRPPERIRIS